MAINYDEQVDLLIDRGVIVEDRDEAIYILSNVNYYIFKGYLYEFKDKSGKYSNISFSQANDIYMFDRRLRSILQYALDIVENSLKTKISYVSAHENGAFGYLNEKFYRNEKEFKIVNSQIKNCLKQNKDVDFIEFNRIKYGERFPIWVSINVFTMGTLDNYYCSINKKVKKLVAEEYDTCIKQLESWIKCIKNVRNKVAHYMRLYNVDMKYIPERCYNNHRENFINSGKLFDTIQIMKFMTNDAYEWNYYILVELKRLLENSEDFVNIELLGFPENWEQILKKHKKPIIK